MAKKQYKAVHRIMHKASPPAYHEPGTVFMMEEKDAAVLVSLGAAVVDDVKPTPEKKAPKKEAKATEPDAPSEDEDLVG